MTARLEAQSQSPVSKVIGIVWSLVMFPILALLLTAIFWAFFNAILGGTATFKQVLAVTSHSYVITALGALAAMPILLFRFKMQMGGPFNLGALAPGLDSTVFARAFPEQRRPCSVCGPGPMSPIGSRCSTGAAARTIRDRVDHLLAHLCLCDERALWFVHGELRSGI
jgi:hypothetical protein